MIRQERTTRMLLSVIALLLGANLLININNAGPARSAMAAGIPDSGAQMQAVVDQLIELNKRVDKMQGLLESGKLAVVTSTKDAK